MYRNPGMSQRQFERSALALLVIIAVAIGAVYLVVHEVQSSHKQQQHADEVLREAP